MFRLFSSISLFIAGGCCFAQNALIAGQVLSEFDHRPVSFAVLQLEGSMVSSFVDQRGYFQINQLSGGTYVLTVEAEGYETLRLSAQVNESEITDLGPVLLTPLKVDLASPEIITLSEAELTEQDVSGNILMLNANDDVFTRRAAFDFSQAFYRVKGLDRKHTLLNLNGLPLNDLLWGSPEWNIMGGLNDVFRVRENSPGLQYVPFTFGGLTGSSSIDTRSSKQRPGLRLTSSAANRTYLGRIALTYTHANEKGTWFQTVSASKRWAEQGYVDGTPYNAHAFFAQTEIRLKRHTFTLLGWYTPVKRGGSASLTKESIDLFGRRYNPYWGLHDGEIRSSRMRRYKQPFFQFNYTYVKAGFELRSAVSYTFGSRDRERLGYYNAPNPDPVYYRYMPGFYLSAFSGANFEAADLARNALMESPQIDWASLYQVNLNKQGEAAYMIYDDRTLVNNIKAFTGFLFRPWKLVHFEGGIILGNNNYDQHARINDLLGAEYHSDSDPFSGSRNDLNGSDVKYLDDIFGYHYQIGYKQGHSFLQVYYKGNQFEAYMAGKYGLASYRRTGMFLNEKYPDDSFGEGEKQEMGFSGYKAGVRFKYTGRHIFDVNLAVLNDPPPITDLYVNVRENDRIVDGPELEKVSYIDLNYYLRLENLTAKFSFYGANLTDHRAINYFYMDSGMGSDFVQEVVTGIGQRHLGMEWSASYQITSSLSCSAVIGYGDYRYTSDPEVAVNFDPGEDSSESINDLGFASLGTAAITGYRVSSGPQKAFSAGLEYRSPDYWWFAATANLLEDNYVAISYNRRTSAFLINPESGNTEQVSSLQLQNALIQEKLPSAYLLNLTGGKSWLMGSAYLSLFIGINNLFDQMYFTGGFEQNRNGNYAQFRSDELTGLPRFGNKYWRGYGRTFFINLSLNLQ
ncbi:carboxypeptidase regulatory-like domain-containing protein [Robertkochia aurantiaca]|uniref:carboxypeptidase regulatory-like domain-containing protein n=1 Tax=Robertkochia aurantiaca TaxID=2873700 RepID=UPI001CCF1DB7|nr:carboxypeptidase regulatory-like domain-containing protein [Robertkochia sp. 3YJGBD-33]